MNGNQSAELLGITAKSLVDAVTLSPREYNKAMKKLVNALRDFDVPVSDFDNKFGGVDNALIMVTTLTKKEFEQYLQDLGLI